MLGLYDLLAEGVEPEHIEAWLGGQVPPAACPVDLPRLSPAERRAVQEAWWFNARPGQGWQPGHEFITDFEAGRGWGKDYAASETICDAACSPERWGGYAIVVGPDPTQVKRDCLFGPSGIFTAAQRRQRSGNGPGIADRNLVDRWLRFEAPRGGGDAGLTVYWAASSDPKSVHGANVGLVWWDEFGVSYHRKYDEQGNNAWGALMPAVRAGPDPKVIITQTPSRAPEVRALQADAERPECPTCRAVYTARGQGRQDALREPWRLARSPQVRLHPLLNTRTTVPVRRCAVCGGEVVARVRAVYGDTRDNPNIARRAREDADKELATGQAWAFLRFAPRGEVDAGAAGSLVAHESIAEVLCDVAAPPPAKSTGQIADRWRRALDFLGATDTAVIVDPAVTASEGSDETGLVAVCLRPVGEADGAGAASVQVVGLQDATVRPDEVGGGAPSVVWAPRAHWLACLWGASRIVVEVNQGGEEVLSAVRDLVARPLTEAQAMARLREEWPELAGVSDARLGLLVRRVVASSRAIAVESVRRRAAKPVRVEWYGRTAARGQQAVLCVEWQGGVQHWSTCLAQGTGYEPPREGTPASGRRDRKDRFDALVSGAQVLLGVRETHRGEVEEPPRGGWMSSVGAGALR